LHRLVQGVANARSAPDPDGRVYDPYNDGPADPLFHFGQGMSYTEFAMSELVATPMPSGPNVLLVAVTVKNTGKVAGSQVVQVYAVDPVTDYVRPWKRLLAFARVTLVPGQSEVVHIPVTAEAMSFQDDSSPAGEWRVVPGEYTIRVGDSSVTDLLTQTVAVDYDQGAATGHGEL
jgi:beta-glucosidase